jgi:hypothetical protein
MGCIRKNEKGHVTTAHRTEFDIEHRIRPITETFGGSHSIQVFVHGISSVGFMARLRAAMLDPEMFPERPLVSARSNDVVCVLKIVDSHYLKFLARLELGPAPGRVVVVSEANQSNSNAPLADLLIKNHEALVAIRALIRQEKLIVLNTYMLSAEECTLAPVLERVLGRNVLLLGGNPDIVEYADHKHNVRAKACELGVPVPEGEVVEIGLQENGKPLDLSPIHDAIRRHIGATGRVIIRGSRGSSGSSTFVVEDNPKSIEGALSDIAGRVDNKIYLVEAMLDSAVSPNILMHIEPSSGSITCVGISDQHLNSDLMHEGNTYPSQARTLRGMKLSARTLARWLRAEGYTGLVGFDFIECFSRAKGNFEHYLAELNPRINAAVYSVSLMERLNEGQKRRQTPCVEAFLSTKVETQARSFAELTELYGHLFFNPRTGKGLVPYNTGWLDWGKYNLAIFGRTNTDVREIFRRFRAGNVSCESGRMVQES